MIRDPLSWVGVAKKVSRQTLGTEPIETIPKRRPLKTTPYPKKLNVGWAAHTFSLLTKNCTECYATISRMGTARRGLRRCDRRGGVE